MIIGFDLIERGKLIFQIGLLGRDLLLHAADLALVEGDLLFDLVLFTDDNAIKGIIIRGDDILDRIGETGRRIVKKGNEKPARGILFSDRTRKFIFSRRFFWAGIK